MVEFFNIIEKLVGKRRVATSLQSCNGDERLNEKWSTLHGICSILPFIFIFTSSFI